MPHPLHAFNIPSGAQFGARRLSGRPHAGTDYHTPDNKDGAPIFGTLSGGTVRSKGWAPSTVNGFGHWVKVAYPGGKETTDAHMREACPLPIGTPVSPSVRIGTVGHTGNAVNADPPGSHVHHELRIGGALVDPFAYYGGTATAGTKTETLTREEDDMPKRVSDGAAIYLIAGNDITHLSPAENDAWDGIAPLFIKNLGQVQGIQASMRRTGNAGQIEAGFAKVGADLNYISNVQPHSLLAIFNRLDPEAPDLVLTEAQLKTLGASVKIDLAALIAGIDASDDAEHAALLEAIHSAPAAFIAKLKAEL